ncbi:carbohydrate-binding protein [Clostridium felsineum]|uniref:CBM35 domain-containing protein n=1 Tax=Clostridium felsineum TaxID=36839 RepID=UPI00214D7DAF|nr:CBM35 domain-containing protein [Clostridium felsineum]MCR3761604.1 carbohydrate-binding protein [Clostridium felsineum]
MNKKGISMILGIIFTISLAGGVKGIKVKAETNNFTVDLSNQYRNVTHVASGSLYGLSDENKPSDDLLMPTKPNVFTQMAPNGGQLPNGEASPTGDALKVAEKAERSGAKINIRFPDMYKDFPYKWISLDDWNSKIDSIVDSTLASKAANIYAYELWNEPNWTWNEKTSGLSFNEVWKKTYDRVKAKDSKTKILGPSISLYDEPWLKNFLTYCKENNCLPDIMCWHELGDAKGVIDVQYIEEHVKDYRNLEKSLGINNRQICIDEYGVTTEEAVPGSMIRYFSEFERAGVESACSAFWFRPGRLSNIITEDGNPNGGWWLYKWYGDMSGKMAMTTPVSQTSLNLDGIASVDSSKKTASVLFGGADGDNNILVKGFNSNKFFNNKVHVKVEEAPWYGVDTKLSQAKEVFAGNFNVVDGKINVPVTGINKSFGYRMTITNKEGYINRYEAEEAVVNHANKFSNEGASNGQYIGQIDYKDSYVEFNVTAKDAGPYNMKIGYANGNSQVSSQKLYVNGDMQADVNYDSTAGWMSSGKSGTKDVQINLKKGDNKIRFSNSQNGYAELDYIQLSKVAKTFKVRQEAENALINNATVNLSSYGSNDAFVGMINFGDSYVQYNVNVPEDGKYKLEVGYANGESSASTQNLSINGGESKVITFEKTGGWMASVPNMGYRKILNLSVDLKKGDNTIKFSKGNTGYVEQDYIEVTK